MRVHSFAPIVDSRSRVLILGSMPGRASLRAGEYYAHPRNLFWPFMERLLGVRSAERYERRVEELLARGVGLWDVVSACERRSSLDADIVSGSIVANDLLGLLEAHRSLRAVCLNGAKAALEFRRHVLPSLPAARRIALYELPSTSPANASIPLARKLEAWSVVSREARAARRSRGVRLGEASLG